MLSPLAVSLPTKRATVVVSCIWVTGTAAGNTPSSHPPVMTLDTQMTRALLQELLLALRANDAEGFKGWLALGLEELGRQVVIELMQDLMIPLLTETEQDRLVGWHLGVSF